MSSLRVPGLPAGRLLLAGIVVLMILIGLPVAIHAAQPGEGSSMSARCEPPPWAASGPSAERDGPLRGSATFCSESHP